jgi:hypothetical protein
MAGSIGGHKAAPPPELANFEGLAGATLRKGGYAR